MKTFFQDNKKIIIGGLIAVIVILLIIWYRNSQKSKEAELSKSKLIPGGNSSTPAVSTDIGKTALVNNVNTTFYTTDGKFNVAYKKATIGEFAGSVLATQTDSGNTSFYKLMNTGGTKVYVLKSQVKLQ